MVGWLFSEITPMLQLQVRGWSQDPDGPTIMDGILSSLMYKSMIHAARLIADHSTYTCHETTNPAVVFDSSININCQHPSPPGQDWIGRVF